MEMTKDEIDFLRESNYIEMEPFTGTAKEDAIAAWEYVKKVDVITVADVLKAHEIIMKTRNTIPWDEKGRFTKWQTGIYSGGNLIRSNPEPELVPDLVDRWIEFMNDSVSELEEDASDEKKDDLAQQLHVEYERIHPFSDGNGRTGRLWWNWHRLKYGLPIKVVWAKERWEYYDIFK